MTNKEALAIVGSLVSGPSCVFVGNNEKDTYRNIVSYLTWLDENITYDFVKDFLQGNFESDIYHKEMGRNSILLGEEKDFNKLYSSEHDMQVFVESNGRLGVWCEPDGFVAWLDEYKKVWVLEYDK